MRPQKERMKEKMLANQLPKDQMLELKQISKLFDQENIGIIPSRELKQRMETLKMDEKSPFMFRLILSLDGLRNYIDFEQFAEAITLKFGDKSTKNGINKIFDLLDENGKGKIDIVSLHHIVSELGQKMRVIELQKILQAISSNGKEITRKTSTQS